MSATATMTRRRTRTTAETSRTRPQKQEKQRQHQPGTKEAGETRGEDKRRRKPGTAIRHERGEAIAEICEYEACKDHEFPVSDARRALVNFVSLPIRQTLYATKQPHPG